MSLIAMLAIQGGVMLLERFDSWYNDRGSPKYGPKAWGVPSTEKGAQIPLLYGTTRAEEPVLAWAGHKRSDLFNGDSEAPAASDVYLYYLDFLVILGIPFLDGPANFRRVWRGETGAAQSPTLPGGITWGGDEYDGILPAVPGDDTDAGSRVTIFGSTVRIQWNVLTIPPVPGGGAGASVDAGGQFRFQRGWSNQTFDLVRNYIKTPTSPTPFANEWTPSLPAERIPSYRGYQTVLAFMDAGSPDTRFRVGVDPDPVPFSFETSTHPANPLWLDGRVGPNGLEANPMDVIRDVLTGTFGKVTLPADAIDLVTFTAAARTLHEEGLGYSRTWSGGTCAELIAEVLEHADAILCMNPAIEKIQIRLIRNGYLIRALPHITPSNCRILTNVDLGSWENVANHIVVTFPNRDKNYELDTVEAIDEATINGQLDERRTAQISAPGACTPAIAGMIASRELGARNRPIAKFTAICGRSMAGLLPGDVVKVTWPDLRMTEIPFRVIAPTRGTLGNREVEVDLVQDFYYRSRLVIESPIPVPLPPGGEDLEAAPEP